jgi:predicted porin
MGATPGDEYVSNTFFNSNASIGVQSVNDLLSTSLRKTSRTRGDRRSAVASGSFLLASLVAATGAVRAQSAAAPADDTLTFHGITLYGLVDIGLQYQSHGAPISDFYPAGTADIVQKNSNHSTFGATPSNLSQSRIGLQGIEPLSGDWSAVFKLETFFNPQSGDISDALKSETQNNGRALAAQSTNLDSSIAGQIFQQSYVGVSSPTFGTFTFGRQNTTLADGVYKYDPQGVSYAFSLIGLSGTTAGAGDTQDRRLDSSLKYVAQFNGFHVGADYKFNGATGSANTAYELQFGGEFAGLSVDAYYSKIKDAIAVSALSAAQVTGLPALGLSSSNSLAGTVSDNSTYSLMAMYSFGAPKIYFGYEHIQFANTSTPLAVGFDDIGGYKLGVVNNTAFPRDKVLLSIWAGVKYSVNSSLDLTAAYYLNHQNSFGTGAVSGCSTTLSAQCSGNLNVVSFSAVYRLSKRFDTYAGFMYSDATDGLASGFINRIDINPTVGVRYKF